MSLDLIKKEGYNAELKLVIPAGDFEKYCNEAYNKNKSKINIPGFRKGKVPKNMIDKYYGEGFFYEDAINMGFSKEYSEGVDALSIEPVARPEIDVEEIKKGQDIVINVKVVIKPDITVENYKGLEISFPKTDVTEKEIDEELESMRNKNAMLKISAFKIRFISTPIKFYAIIAKFKAAFDARYCPRLRRIKI